LLAGELNWDTLLELADEHGLQGMLAKRLDGAGYAGVPTVAREKLQARVRAQHLFTLSLTAELFRILDDFSNAHIDSIPVKGPVISQLAYGDPALRSFGDLDLLLRHRDIEAAIERMKAMGFDLDASVKALQAGKIPGEYLFRRIGTPRLVELHTEKTFRHYPEPMRIEEMIERKRRMRLDGREVPVLSLEDEVVFDCVHGGKDFWERLMWVSDVAAILARYPEIDWEKARRAAVEVGAGRMLFTGLQLATVILGSRLPQGIAESIQRDPETQNLCGEIQRWLPYAGCRAPGLTARAAYRVKMGGGGITGVTYLMRLSLSPTEDDWEEDDGERKSWFWETVRRPFRLMKKYRTDR